MKKKRFWIVLIVLLISAGSYFAYESSQHMALDMFVVEEGHVVQSFVEEGIIEAVHTAEIQSRVSGTVKETLKEIGDDVYEKEKLLLFDDDVIVLQIEGVEAEIKALNYQLIEASKPVDQERMTNASLAVTRARDYKDQMKKNYEDQMVLFHSGHLSQRDLDASKKAYDDAVSLYYQAVNESKLINKGISESLESQYQASIEAAFSKQKVLERQLQDYDVISPMKGTVVSTFVKTGHFVQVGQPLYEIADLNVLRLSCDVLEEDYHLIDLNTPVMLIDSTQDIEYDGKIIKIYPKSSAYTSNLGIQQNRVKVFIDPRENLQNYIVGQTLDIKFITKQVNSVIRVPVDAVVQWDSDHYVFINNEDILSKQSIVVGLKGNDYYEVVSGLTVGDEIVNVITNELDEGIKLK